MTDQDKKIKTEDVEIDNIDSIDIDIPACPMCNEPSRFDDDEDAANIENEYILLRCDNERCCMEKYKVPINLNFK